MKKKRLLSWFLALVMVLGLLPVSAMAAEKDAVYISASYDGQYLEADDGGYIAYAPVELEELEKINLVEYGLADYQYDDHITALHLLIYAHETLCGEEWEDVRVSGGAGSIFFEGGLFGFSDCNLNYYVNGKYPAIGDQGLTADQIVLNPGDFVDLASYSGWSFWMDSAAGFHYFMDGSKITHEYKVAAGETLTVALGRAGGGMGGETMLNPEVDYPVSYGSALFASDAEKVSTDGNGEIELSFADAGTYYLWADGGYGAEYYEIVSSPAYAKVTVEGDTEPDIGEPEGGNPDVQEPEGGNPDVQEPEGGNPSVQEPEENNTDWQEVMPKTEAYLLNQAKDNAPVVNSTYGEWMVLGLARSGVDADSDFFDDYYLNVVSHVKENMDENGRLHPSKSTENSRLILALTALGYDVTDVGGYNLLKGLTDKDYVPKQGINGPVWALIALDSGDYDIPANADSTKQVTREWLVEYILEKQLPGGGWGLDDTPDDMTPMAVQALAPYYDSDSTVKQAVDKAIGIMDEMLQNAPSPETSAQIIVALSALEKDSSAAMKQMLKYSLEDGSFAHEQGTNQMATEQAFYALVAYDRFQNGENALYDMSDVEKQTDVPGKPSEGGSNKPSGDKTEEKKEEIEVTFRLIGDSQHEDGVKDHEAYVTWIATETYKMEEGDTMYDVFVEAIEDHGLKQRGAENDYVESIKAPKCLGGYWLGEFDNGQNSGWMYTVDGDHPNVGLKYYELQDGDDIIWHYVDDYVKEERNSSSDYYYRWLEAEDIDPEDYAEELEEKEQEEEAEEVPAEEEPAEEEVPATEKTEPVDVSFADVSETDWFYKDVAFAVEKGLFSGTGDGNFSPNASMNRAMLVTVLYRLAEAGEVYGSSDFADVPADQWYHDAVMWAAENGIVHGYDNGSFGSMDSITREQMATILFRYAAYMGYDTDAANSLASYRDSGSISPFAQKPLQWANGVGLISGRTVDTLDPLGSVTRAEVASILHRFVKNVA